MFDTLRKKGAFVEGIVTKPNKFAEQDFALERAAFYFNGSWCVNVYHDMNPNLEYWAMVPPPINPNLPMRVWGGTAGSSFVVNNSSRHKDEAIAFLTWLSAAPQQAYLAKETRNLPANRDALSSIPDILSEFARVTDETTHPSIWKYNENSLVLEAFDKGLQAIIIGEKTPQQMADDVQRVKEKQLQKARDRKQD